MWHEFIITAPDALREPITAILFDLGCEGVYEDGGLLRAYFPDTAPLGDVSDALVHLEGVTFEQSELAEQDWYAPWKEKFSLFEVEGLTVCPPWREHMPQAGEKLILLDPGQAFGAGEHVTTRTVIKMIRGWVDAQHGLEGKRFLDLGAGTGILAIAGYMYGLRDVTAVDVEIRAVETTARNLSLNGLVGKIKLMPGSIMEAGKGYDLIAANIFLEVLVELMPDIAAALNPAGSLILSGFMVDQKEQVVTAASRAGLVLDDIISDGRWVSATFLK